MVPARLIGVLLLVAAVVSAPRPWAQGAPDTLPATLTDAEFWKLSTELSEPAGSFRSENLVSNEHTYQYVLPDLTKAVRPGAVYMGVAPDQNFTYIAAVRPRMAFIVDIRRGNLLQHLMYKAVFELSANRAEFVSRLFSKPRPAGLRPTASVVELFSAFARVGTSEQLYRANLRAVISRLTKGHGFALSPSDLEQLEAIYFAFFWEGPSLRYSTIMSGFGNGRGRGGFPTYEEMIIQTDFDGTPRSYLASEENFRVIKTMQEHNLIVPVMGNFAGPKAIRAVGRFVRARGGAIGAFYVSNVEQYLFQDGLFDAFARNVATLPVDDRSTFIRSVRTQYGYPGSKTWSDGRATALYPIREFNRDFQLGLLRAYYDVNARSR
jgi:hypothetical protein